MKNINLYVWLASIAYLVLFLIGLLFFLMPSYGFLSLVLGVVFATIPVPLYLWILKFLDSDEPEPYWLISATFVWGATIAIILSMIVNTYFLPYVGEFVAVFVAPCIEEFSKASALFILFWWFRKYFNNFYDGIIYAAAVGLGFAMTENIIYYARAFGDTFSSGLSTFVLRGILLSFVHPFFTALTGIGMGLSLSSPNKWIQTYMPWIGFGCAILMHAIFNAAATMGSDWLQLLYFLLCAPVLVFFLVYSLYRKGIFHES